MTDIKRDFPLGRPPVHDWDELLDGEVHILTKGTDYNCQETSFRTLIHRSAKARGLKARVSIGRGNATGTMKVFSFKENL